MREGVDALERRARALREELESRDGMLEAVQTQAKMDVEDARRERDEARREAKAEKTMRMEAAAMALTALEAKARSEAAMEARDEATPREGEARRELDDAEARLKRAEEAVRARGAGDGDVALTPGRSPSAASFAKKVALVEARVRGDVERRRDELLSFLRRERKGGNARGRGGGGDGHLHRHLLGIEGFHRHHRRAAACLLAEVRLAVVGGQRIGGEAVPKYAWCQRGRPKCQLNILKPGMRNDFPRTIGMGFQALQSVPAGH